MTEFVGGSVFLWSVLEVITDYFDEEVVNKLEVTLDSINQVLDDAEIKQYQNLTVKNWLNDLKHELYEVEQLLDVVAIDSQGKGKIGRFISSTVNRFDSRIKVLLIRLNVLAEQKNILGLQENSDGIRFSEQLSRELTTELLVDDESVIFGRQREKEEIIDFLLANSYFDGKVPIISIVGLMGMGKTTLAQLVFNDRRIIEQFDIKLWVHVSESFDLIRLTRSILKSIHSSAADGEDLDILQRQLRLKGKRYLLVLDDVWNKDRRAWDNFVLRFSGFFGGKMIVTTRDMEVASVMGSTRLLHLKQLEKNAGWSLFVKYAFQGRNVFQYPNLELIGKKIVKKCGGLPLALKTLGIILGTKSSESEWVKILETDLWRLPEVDNHINSILRLSYFNLSSSLKRCFAYCSIFPKGYEFNKGELIKLCVMIQNSICGNTLGIT